jgi:Protein of unknown function (DUF2637)
VTGMTGHLVAAGTWFRLHVARLTAGLAILTVAVVTGRVSYWHIYDLSIALHQPAKVARLMPFGVDGLMVIGSVAVLSGTRWGWLGIGPGAAISLFANVESGLAYGKLPAAWAGVASVTFALSTFIFERWLKAQATVPEVGDTAPVESPVRLPAPVAEPVQTPVPAPTPLVSPVPRVAREQGQANRTAILQLRDLHPDWTKVQIAAELGTHPKTVSRHLAAVNGSG